MQDLWFERLEAFEFHRILNANKCLYMNLPYVPISPSSFVLPTLATTIGAFPNYWEMGESFCI